MSAIRFLGFSIALGALIFFVTLAGVETGWLLRPSLLTEIVALNVLVTFVLYRLLIRIHTPQVFVNGYLGSIVVKLLVCIALLLTVRIVSPQDLSPNAILFVVCYVLFTILEITFLYLKLGR